MYEYLELKYIYYCFFYLVFMLKASLSDIAREVKNNYTNAILASSSIYILSAPERRGFHYSRK